MEEGGEEGREEGARRGSRGGRSERGCEGAREKERRGRRMVYLITYSLFAHGTHTLWTHNSRRRAGIDVLAFDS